MNKKYTFRIYIGLISISIVAYISFVVYEQFVKHCQNEYGLSYNKTREKLGIPLIPADWSIKERSENFIGWSGNEQKVGHKRKAISFSGCRIESELDVFKLPNQNGKERLLEIEYNYPHESTGNTVIYTYQIDHYSKSISKTTADSILNSEHIKKE
ncbi:hypothetical protein [Pedobacter sp. HMWF019]|uniref:hypothetical protein n=1 Tax=Pedobacter sp. HMWF019 TaxID=2056856 RepID=UPI0011B26E75|nr:hypothetical protein [Pedobacter sp. HMWF019]